MTKKPKDSMTSMNGGQSQISQAMSNKGLSVSEATESVPDHELAGDNIEKIDDFLFTSPFTATNFYKRRRQNDQPQQNYMTLYCQDYMFRIKTKAVFEDLASYYIFDFYVLGDQKFDEYFMFENIWRETLLMNKFYKDHLLQVLHSQENQLPCPSLKTVKVK